MTHPSEQDPYVVQDGTRITVCCPRCGWVHRTVHARLAERLRAHHRCAQRIPAGLGA